MVENRKGKSYNRWQKGLRGGWNMTGKTVLYQGQKLILTRFWGNNEPCLWITGPEQRVLPKMEFVGGHPDEYCIFVKNLSEEELSQITLPDGTPLEIGREFTHK